MLKTNLVEQPSVASGVALPSIAVPCQEGGVVLPEAPARFMDVGGTADGADALGDIGVKAARRPKLALGRRAADRVGMAVSNKGAI